MMFSPEVPAFVAYEMGEDDEGEKERLEEKVSSPSNFERVLKKMDKQVQEVIEGDEEKLKKEEKKIASIRQKINKEEQKYTEMEQELVENEEIQAALDKEKLAKAEGKLKSQIDRKPKSGMKEILEGAIHDLTSCATNNLSEIGENAASDESSNPTLASNEALDETSACKMQKKLTAVSKHINDLRHRLAIKKQMLVQEDNELLYGEARKIEHLQEQLKAEELKYAELEAKLTEELQFEAQIREEEKKVKELNLKFL